MMMKAYCYGFISVLTWLGWPNSVVAETFTGAPPPFAFRGETVVPVDFEKVDISYTFDTTRQVASAYARVVFRSEKSGWPMFDLVADASELILNGQSLSRDALVLTSDPTGATRLRVLTAKVEAESTNTLEIAFTLPANNVTFLSGRARAGFFMSDLKAGGRGFFEQYGPASFEFDQVAYSFDVKVIGTDVEHEIFVNGQVMQLARNEWRVDFPAYFTTSSLYFHLSEKGRFTKETFTYQAMERELPAVVYAESRELVNAGVRGARQVMAELEAAYGPYLHDQIVVYVTPGGGGMEYAGATMTSLGALGHEFLHFWFARGVMPANGNAGWIDEGIARWRDNGYPRARGPANRSPMNLGGFSDYQRNTSRDSYTYGSLLFSELDWLFRDLGGLRPMLRTLYRERQASSITVGEFYQFLTEQSGHNLAAIFNRYVYGRAAKKDEQKAVQADQLSEHSLDHHPRPYTEQEHILYR